MNGKEEFENIKERFKYYKKEHVEKKFYSVLEKVLFEDCETLITIIDTLDKKQMQDKIIKNSL